MLLRTSPPLLRLQAYFLVRIFLLFLLFACFSFFFFFLMSWSSLREEAGLLVSLEGGEGGELVPYSSLQECEIWFENGEPSHTLFCLFHSSICARKLCFTPPTHPPTLTTCHLLLHLSFARSWSAVWRGRWFE